MLCRHKAYIKLYGQNPEDKVHNYSDIHDYHSDLLQNEEWSPNGNGHESLLRVSRNIGNEKGNGGGQFSPDIRQHFMEAIQSPPSTSQSLHDLVHFAKTSELFHLKQAISNSSFKKHIQSSFESNNNPSKSICLPQVTKEYGKTEPIISPPSSSSIHTFLEQRLVMTSNPSILCTELPPHWRSNKSLHQVFRVVFLHHIPDNTRVVLTASNEENQPAELRNNETFTRTQEAQFEDLRFIGRSGRGKFFNITITVSCVPPVIGLYSKAIKVTVDGPRGPRVKPSSTGAITSSSSSSRFVRKSAIKRKGSSLSFNHEGLNALSSYQMHSRCGNTSRGNMREQTNRLTLKGFITNNDDEEEDEELKPIRLSSASLGTPSSNSATRMSYSRSPISNTIPVDKSNSSTPSSPCQTFIDNVCIRTTQSSHAHLLPMRYQTERLKTELIAPIIDMEKNKDQTRRTTQSLSPTDLQRHLQSTISPLSKLISGSNSERGTNGSVPSHNCFPVISSSQSPYIASHVESSSAIISPSLGSGLHSFLNTPSLFRKGHHHHHHISRPFPFLNTSAPVSLPPIHSNTLNWPLVGVFHQRHPVPVPFSFDSSLTGEVNLLNNDDTKQTSFPDSGLRKLLQTGQDSKLSHSETTSASLTVSSNDTIPDQSEVSEEQKKVWRPF